MTQAKLVYIKKREQWHGNFYFDGKRKRYKLCSRQDAEFKPTARGLKRRSGIEIQAFLTSLWETKENELKRKIAETEKPKQSPWIKETMQAWLDSLIELSPHTVQTYSKSCSYYIEFIGNHRLDKFERHFKDLLLTSFSKLEIRPATVRAHIVQLQTFFNWCEEEGEDWWMTRRVKLKKPKMVKSEPKVFTIRELKKMETHLKKLLKIGKLHRQKAYQNHLRLFILARETAMRASEMLYLPLINIDLDSGFIHIKANGSFKPKVGQEGKIIMSDVLEAFLRKDIKTRDEKEVYFLDSGNGFLGFTNVTGMTQAFSRHWTKLGISGPKPLHGIRATIMTLVSNDETGGILEGSLLGRHSDISVTSKHYVRKDQKRLKSALDSVLKSKQNDT